MKTKDVSSINLMYNILIHIIYIYIEIIKNVFISFN